MCPSPDIVRAIQKLPKEKVKANTKGNRAEKTGDGLTYRKWCALCGKEILTVNSSRLCCNECQQKAFADAAAERQAAKRAAKARREAKTKLYAAEKAARAKARAKAAKAGAKK